MSDEEYDDQVATFTSLFEDLFTARRDSINPELGTILKSNQTNPISEALSIATISAAKKAPADIESLVVPITQVFNSDDIKAIIIQDGMDGPESLDDKYKVQLAEMIADNLFETALDVPKHTVVSPQNPTLATAVFSATVLKHKLLELNSPYQFIRQGLQLPDSRFDDEDEAERQEVVGIGACIHFAILGTKGLLGSNLWFEEGEGQDAVVKALKSLKEKGVIRHPQGLALLEETIIKVESNSSEQVPSKEVWNNLFPSKD